MLVSMAHPAPPLDELGELEGYIRGLEQQRKALLKTQIDLEHDGFLPTKPEPGTTPAERQTKFLNGYASVDAGLGLSGGEKLFEIIADRTAIADAIAELERKRLRLEGQRNAAKAEEMAPQWRALCHDIITTAERLRHLEARAADVPMKVKQLLPLSEFVGVRSVVGINWNSDPVGELRRAALKLGVITQGDISEAKS